jgi:NTP pyrophosphatase (non-canonical NTP hydrolase)
MGQIQDLQRRTWKNKLAKKFNTTNVEREFNYTYAELAEAYEVYRKGGAAKELGYELADTVIFIMSLAEMTGIDLETAIQEKMTINENRTYIEETDHIIKKENS